MTTFVVGRDGDVNELSRGVGVTESNDGDIDVGGFFDSLCISARVGDDDEAGLFERASDVVGEIARGETTSDSNSAGMSGELEDGSLTVRTSGNDGYISGVVDSYNDASCEDDFLPSSSIISFCKRIAYRFWRFLPGLSNVDHVNSIWACLPQIRLHMSLHILGAQMTLSCKKHLNILRGSIEH